MRFDRQIFFEKYRLHFGPLQHQYQVDGLNRLLTGFETYHGWWDNIRQIANALAQVGWETAHSYNPVEEAYYLGDPSKPGYFDGENSQKVKRVQKAFRYSPHFGRGDIQLTWLENYADMNVNVRKYFPERVKDFEARTGQPLDLVKYPDQATDGWISFCIFTIGMHFGTFREGHHLDRYITPSRTDYFNARNIVNGDKNYVKQDKRIGDHIAEASTRFEKCLRAALISKPEFTDDEIAQLTSSLNSTSTADRDPAGSIGDLQSPTLNTVELPGSEAGFDQLSTASGDGSTLAFTGTVSETTETEDGSLTVQQSVQTPIGDAPDAKPSFMVQVEDWKNWVMRKLKLVWGFGIFGNISQATGLLGLAANDPGRSHIYIGIAIVLFIVIAGAGLLITAGLVGLLIWNRREISHYITESFRHRADPELKNFALQFEKK